MALVLCSGSQVNSDMLFSAQPPIPPSLCDLNIVRRVLKPLRKAVHTCQLCLKVGH